jgi:hypothetical protein
MSGLEYVNNSFDITVNAIGRYDDTFVSMSRYLCNNS